MKLRERVAALLGVSTYTAPERMASLSEAAIDQIRRFFGGQLTPPHFSEAVGSSRTSRAPYMRPTKATSRRRRGSGAR